MNIGIISSADDKIDNYYKSIATSVAGYLAKDGFNLVFGGGSTSLMGVCYREFLREGRKITAVATRKYKDELDNLRCTDKVVCETTFDMKKEFFENSDIIVALPGGIGTFSELYSFIEEKRSNDKDIPIEIYDEDGYYLPFIEQLQMMVTNNMASPDIFDYFKVSRDKDEFVEHIESYRYKIENKGEMLR